MVWNFYIELEEGGWGKVGCKVNRKEEIKLLNISFSWREGKVLCWDFVFLESCDICCFFFDLVVVVGVDVRKEVGGSWEFKGKLFFRFSFLGFFKVFKVG